MNIECFQRLTATHPRENFEFSRKEREFNPQKSCALFYTTNQASHNELMPAIARSHEFRRSFGMVQKILEPSISMISSKNTEKY